MTEVVLSQFRGEGALLASGNDNGADDQCTTTRTARRIRPMEQFDPEIQKRFIHAPKIDPLTLRQNTNTQSAFLHSAILCTTKSINQRRAHLFDGPFLIFAFRAPKGGREILSHHKNSSECWD
jgi:hypothetical protein